MSRIPSLLSIRARHDSALNCPLAVMLSLTCILAGCGAISRRPSPLVDRPDVAPVGFSREIRWSHEETRQEFLLRTAAMAERWKSLAAGRRLKFLALSGGGSGGAFGAGVLVGWSEQGTRPQFDAVTGVSTGALLAPFAFLGPKWDPELRKAFSGLANKPFLRSTWIGTVFGTSAFKGSPLRELVERFVTPELLSAVAAESAKGRILLVSTTDLDRDQIVVWNMGLIAATGGTRARSLFRDVLVASASVPGVFPPVMIRVEGPAGTFDEMHVDGGTKTSLVAMPDIGAVIDNDLGPMEHADIYVLINGKLGSTPVTTRLGTLSVLKRSVAGNLKAGARSSILMAYSFALRHSMSVRATAIAEEYPFAGPLDFSPETMQGLFDYGFRCAVSGEVWDDPLAVLDRSSRRGQPAEGTRPGCPAMGGSSR